MEYYTELGTRSDLREPHRIPQQFLTGLFEKEAPAVAPVPVIAFINSRSGGHAGPALSEALYRALGSTQVFDLETHRPDRVLKKLWENFQSGSSPDADQLRGNLRIVACGGDGTVAWVLQTIARLDLQPAPPVAVIPLGTGNDLARSFGWGGAFNKAWIKGHKALRKTLTRCSEATPAPLDRWRVNLTVPRAEYFEGKRPYGFVAQGDSSEATSIAAEAWNYISVGMDAKAAQGFHHLRDTKPKLAFSRTANQAWYVYYSCTSGWFCGAEPLSRRLKIEVLRNGQWEDLEITSAVRAVVLLNLQSYGGGRNLWGKHTPEAEEKGFVHPSNCDGLLEVVAFKSGYHAGVVMAGGMHAVRLAQAAGVRMRVRGSDEEGNAYMQLDGEPWKQSVPGIKTPESEALQVEVTLQGQSRMLLAPGAKASVPARSTADKAVGASHHRPAGASVSAEAATRKRAEAADIATGRHETSMGLSELPSTIGAAVSMPHVALRTPDTATGGLPMPPAQAQNVPAFQTSGRLPDPEEPVTSEALSALAAASVSQTGERPAVEEDTGPDPQPSTSVAGSEGSNITMPAPPHTDPSSIAENKPEDKPLAALPELDAESVLKSEASASSKFCTSSQ